MKTILRKNTNHETESLNPMNVATVLEGKIVLFTGSAKILEREGAYYHPAFMGNYPTLSHTILVLPNQ